MQNWRITQASAAYTIASGPNPTINALDMIVLATLSRMRRRALLAERIRRAGAAAPRRSPRARAAILDVWSRASSTPNRPPGALADRALARGARDGARGGTDPLRRLRGDHRPPRHRGARRRQSVLDHRPRSAQQSRSCGARDRADPPARGTHDLLSAARTEPARHADRTADVPARAHARSAADARRRRSPERRRRSVRQTVGRCTRDPRQGAACAHRRSHCDAAFGAGPHAGAAGRTARRPECGHPDVRVGDRRNDRRARCLRRAVSAEGSRSPLPQRRRGVRSISPTTQRRRASWLARPQSLQRCSCSSMHRVRASSVWRSRATQDLREVVDRAFLARYRSDRGAGAAGLFAALRIATEPDLTGSPGSTAGPFSVCSRRDRRP